MEPDGRTDDGLDEVTNGDGDTGADDEHAPPRPVDRFRTTAVGSVVAAGLLGLRDALEGRPEREEIAIVNPAPERPVDDGVQLVFDEETKTVKVTLPRPPRP